MIRALVIVAVAGFITSIVCISGAVAIGGPAALARGGLTWDWDDGSPPHRFGFWRRMHRGGPQSTRDFPWSWDRLEVDAPADISFVQAAGPAKLTIRGPAAELDRVRVEDGRIRVVDGPAGWETLHVTLTAPAVTRFELRGSNSLSITGYRQDQLTVMMSGHGDVTAQGETKAVNLKLAGAGEADMSELKTAGADIDISGAGAATVGPTDWARVRISGVGDVDLLTRPPRLETDIAGAGSIHQPDGGANVGSSGRDGGRGPARAA